MSISIASILRRLNRALRADRAAMSKLLRTRVRCNRALADDPDVQVAARGRLFSVGALGLLNGAVGASSDQWGKIVAVQEKDGTVKRFERRRLFRSNRHDRRRVR